MAQYLKTCNVAFLSRFAATNRAGLPVFLSTSVQSTPTPPPAGSNGNGKSDSLKSNHKVNDLERKFLVWTKKYKTVEEVPAFVSQDVMERARNKIRIKLANIMMAVTAVGCLIMVFSGKKAQERGETVQKKNMDWHDEYNKKAREDYEKQVVAASAKK